MTLYSAWQTHVASYITNITGFYASEFSHELSQGNTILVIQVAH